MKCIDNIIGIALMAVAIMSCGGQQQKQGTKFAPKERTSSLTDSERREALAQKQAELLGGLNLDTLLYSHGVKFSIVQPKVQGEDITQDIADRLVMKMLQMACQNGISGLGTNPSFVFGTEIAQTGRAATGTTPQKMTVQYQLTYKVMNAVTGDVYATANQDVMGVGNSFVEANQNFVKEIKNTPEIQKMLQTASERIVKWYNENLQAVKNQVEKAEGEGNYDLALAILTSIPEQSTAYKYVAEKQDALLKGMLHKKAADMLGEMTAAIASAGDDFDASIGAYFNLIPTDAPEHAKAQELYKAYTQKCKERRDALEAKAERDEQAAREFEKFNMMQDHETELAQIEADKIKSKYASLASAKAAEAKAKASRKSGGLFGSMGDAISGTFDRVFKVADVAGALATDKLGLGGYVEKAEFGDFE
ncbi:MAG: hypothetical protein IJT46_06440 [Bacteroidaceae bacterium]|nr:hypothetical protein [Bacteroidaceae bacterium]